MMKRFSLILLTLLLLLSAVPSLLAQSQAIDGNIEGYVRSKDGQPIAESRVKVSNANTGFTREATTNDKGYYLVQLLPPGTYSVTAAKQGFNTTMRSGIPLSVGQVVRVDVELPVGNVETVVQVTAEAPVVETGRTTGYSNVYTEREARNIPLSSRNPLALYILNPIINSQRVSNGGSGTSTPSISYSGYGATLYNVDGVTNNISGGARNVVMSAEAIAEYQTLTSPSAEYGRTTGATLNTISRSGTNNWHSSVYLFTKQKELAARPYLLAADRATPAFERYNYGATVAGPVVKDKAFFFLSYERWSQDQPIISTFGGAQQAQIANQIGIPTGNYGTWTTTFRAHTVTAKGDVELSRRNRLSLRYNMYNDIEASTSSGSITREVSPGYKDYPQSGTAQLVTTFTPNVLNELRMLYGFRQVINPVPYPENPAINLSGIGTFNGNADGQYQYYESGYQIIDNVSWNHGRHSFKTGFELLPANYQDRTTNWNGTFTFAGLSANAQRAAVTPLNQYLGTVAGEIDPSTGRPYTYSQFTRSSGTEFYDATLRNLGFFFQDDIRLTPRLKLNAGLRYEYFGRPGGNLNPAYPQTANIPQDRNNFAPRLSLAWDPFGSGKTVLRAGWGIYYNPTSAASYDSWKRQNGITVRSVTVLPTQDGAPAFTRGQVPAFNSGTAAIPNLYTVADDYRDGQAQQWSAGIEREILPGYSLSVSYLGARVTNMTYAAPSNLTQIGVLADDRIQYSGSVNRPDPKIGTIYSVRSRDTWLNYNALLVVLKHQAARGLTFQAGYQYQHITGCFDRTVPTASGACFNQGVSSMNQPNRFTATAVWEPRWNIRNRAASAVLNGWLLSNSSMIQNGFPYTAVTGQDNNGDGAFNDRPIGFGMSTFRMPLYVQIDFRLSRKFPIRELGALEVFAEAVNSTNNANIYGVNATWGAGATPNASFGTPTSAEIPRQWQMGFRYAF